MITNLLFFVQVYSFDYEINLFNLIKIDFVEKIIR